LTAVAECFVDLNFLVDSSGSINSNGENNYDLMLQFVANVTRILTIGPIDTQVAFMLFSDVATVEWGLRRYQDKDNLINAIRNVRYIGNASNLNDALYLTWSNVFVSGSGTRRNARKVTVILTDSIDDEPVEANATRCKSDGIRLITVGVTNMTTSGRLMQIASSPSDLFSVNDFVDLENTVAVLTQQICTTPATSILTHSAYTFEQQHKLLLT